MSDPLQHVSPGEPFNPSAGAWNAFVDSARTIRDQRSIFTPGRREFPPPPLPVPYIITESTAGVDAGYTALTAMLFGTLQYGYRPTGRRAIPSYDPITGWPPGTGWIPDPIAKDVIINLRYTQGFFVTGEILHCIPDLPAGGVYTPGQVKAISGKGHSTFTAAIPNGTSIATNTSGNVTLYLPQDGACTWGCNATVQAYNATCCKLVPGYFVFGYFTPVNECSSGLPEFVITSSQPPCCGYGYGASSPSPSPSCGGGGCTYTAIDSTGTARGSVGPWHWSDCAGACPAGCTLPGPPSTPPTSGSDTFPATCV